MAVDFQTIDRIFRAGARAIGRAVGREDVAQQIWVKYLERARPFETEREAVNFAWRASIDEYRRQTRKNNRSADMAELSATEYQKPDPRSSDDLTRLMLEDLVEACPSDKARKLLKGGLEGVFGDDSIGKSYGTVYLLRKRNREVITLMVEGENLRNHRGWQKCLCQKK